MAMEQKQAKLLLDLSILTYLILSVIGYVFYNQFIHKTVQNFFPIAFLLFLMVITYAYRNKLEQKIPRQDLTGVLISYIVIVVIALIFTVLVIMTYPSV